jgi:hypothetical protein
MIIVGGAGPGRSRPEIDGRDRQPGLRLVGTRTVEQEGAQVADLTVDVTARELSP